MSIGAGWKRRSASRYRLPRARIVDTTRGYINAAESENALYRADFNKRLEEIENLATRLGTLLFQGNEQIDILAAAIAKRGLDDPVPEDDEARPTSQHVETREMALENSLRRAAINCQVEIHRAPEPGFVEHEAWDNWIVELLAILREAGLPHRIATSEYDYTSPSVRFVDALQLLLSDQLRRHGGAPLPREMMAARKRKEIKRFKSKS